MIQLQHLDDNGVNLGGLYVQPDEIAAVYAVCSPNKKPKAYIVLRCGVRFCTAQSVSDILDLIPPNAESEAS